MDKAKSLININSSTTYSGNGVNVGIIDAGYPDDTTNFSKNEIVDYNTTTTSSHTTKVASIIGGTYGIATNADLYIHTYTPYTDSYDFDDAIEWLLDYGVNVVNISMYTDSLTGNQGKYDGYSAYMDHVVWNNYLTIVKSAGNRGADDDYVTNPGVGTNTLSVGSIDGDKNISYFSSWKVNSSVDDVLMKPSLVAPGEYISIPNTNNSSYNSMSGTSFAAPMVTGTIALLMEEFPRLMQYPEAYMSALISGASKLPSQSSVWDNYAGAGLIDYEATREILNSSSYVNASVTNSTSKSTAVISKDVSIGANKEIDYCLFLVQNSNVTSPSSTVYTPNISKYQVIVYDENNEIVETTEYGENSNLIIGTMTNSSTTTKTYTLKVYLVNKTTSNTEYLSLSIYNHTHSYDHSYLWVSYTNHYGYCHCDEFQLQGHAVASGSYNAGQRFATCLLCGGSAEIGFVQLTINSSAVTKVTINGSFILPNGVIVLEDEDLEAYLNGTLVFYDKDKVPEIQ